jgi:uncharacterized membrane protein YccF (DUF307 family)
MKGRVSRYGIWLVYGWFIVGLCWFMIGLLSYNILLPIGEYHVVFGLRYI